MSFNKKVVFQIEATDNATSKFKALQGEIKSVSKAAGNISSAFSGIGRKFSNEISLLQKSLKLATIGITGLAAATAYAAKKSVQDSMKMENALMGLTTVARAFGVAQDDAKQAAIELSKDGLMTVTEAANGLKNLMASKFNLPEAIRLMNGFKDSAAYNRQAALGFGEAIVGATEGIKNQNSILVDNAGITKNLSIILKEAGYSQQDLMNVTTDAGVRQALFNGILKETSIFQGDAGRSAGTLTGQLSMLKTSVFNLSSSIGDQLKPYVKEAVEEINRWVNSLIGGGGVNHAVEQVISKIKEWVESVGGPEGIKQRLIDFKDTMINEVLPAFLNLISVISTIIGWLWNHRDVVIAVIIAYESWKIATTAITVATSLFNNGLVILNGTIAVTKNSIALLTTALGVVIAVIGVVTVAAWKVNQAFDGTTGTLQKFRPVIMSLFGPIGTIVDMIRNWDDWLNRITGSWNSLRDLLNKGISATIDIVEKVKKKVSGKKAAGGPVMTDNTYLVGESGPELFTPSTSGTIIPNNQLSSGGQTFNFNFQGAMISDKSQLISEIKQAINRELELSRYGIG